MQVEKRFAYFVVLRDDGHYTLGIATENESGYNLVKPGSDIGGSYGTGIDGEIAADKVSQALNKRLGLEPREAALIVASSIRVSDIQRDDETIKARPHRQRRR